MKKPSIEERLVNEVAKIHTAIHGLSNRLKFLYNNRKFPVGTIAEQYEEEWKEQREEQRRKEEIELLTKENKILIRTVKIVLFGIIVSAILGAVDIVLRIFFNK